jgi:hypothetical protein
MQGQKIQRQKMYLMEHEKKKTYTVERYKLYTRKAGVSYGQYNKKSTKRIKMVWFNISRIVWMKFNEICHETIDGSTKSHTEKRSFLKLFYS